MVLGPRVPGPRCPVETPEQTRKRRAARVARQRKAAQSGEGTHRPSPPIPGATTSGQGPSQLRPRPPQTKPKNSVSTGKLQEQLKKAEASLQKRNKEHNSVLETFETLNKELDSVKVQLADTTKQYQDTSKTLDESIKTSETQLEEKRKENEELLMSNESLSDELTTAKKQLEDVTREKKVLADSMTKIVQPFSNPSVDELAELVTSIWTERDIIFQEVKSDLSKTRLAKEKAEDQSRRDAEALRAAQDPTKTKAHLIKTQEQSKVFAEERNAAVTKIEELKNEKNDLVMDNISLTTVSADLPILKQKIKKLERSLEDASDQIVIGESSILVLEGEKEDLMEQLHQMKKENQTISSDLNTASGEKGSAFEELEAFLSEVRSITGLSQSISPADSAEKLREEWNKRKNPSQKQGDEEIKREDKSLQVEIGDNGDASDQLQKLLIEVRSIAGLSKNVSPEDSAEKLRKAWEDQEKVFKKLQEREKKKEKKTLEEVAGKNNERFQKLLSEVQSIAGLPEDVSPEDSAEKLREAWKKHEKRYLKAQTCNERKKDLVAKIKVRIQPDF
eukprot:XP_011665295.1 PREDICTED: myosin heavy chain, cardiac muscle isoform-like [Strongylocentrotus purpuratus]